MGRDDAKVALIALLFGIGAMATFLLTKGRAESNGLKFRYVVVARPFDIFLGCEQNRTDRPQTKTKTNNTNHTSQLRV